MKKYIVICVLALSGVAYTEASQSQTGAEFSGRWAASVKQSVGPVSLGGIIEIQQSQRRLTIIRRVSPRESVTWSCEIGGGDCHNSQSADAPVTVSRVERVGQELIISTRAVDRQNVAVNMRRSLSLDSAGRLIVTTSTTGSERTDRTVYLFHGKAVQR